MAGSHYIALSGMRSRLDAARSHGLRHRQRQHRRLQERAVRRCAGRQAPSPFSSALQSAIDVTSGDRRLDVSAGTMAPTGRDLDVALEGDGFFVATPAARATRATASSRAADGVLVTDDGSAVQGVTGPIQLGRGTVRSSPMARSARSGGSRGQAEVVDFDDPGGLPHESGAALRAVGATPVDRGPAGGPGRRARAVERLGRGPRCGTDEVTRSFEALQSGMSC